jgi:hypothetical protein
MAEDIAESLRVKLLTSTDKTDDNPESGSISKKKAPIK